MSNNQVWSLRFADKIDEINHKWRRLSVSDDEISSDWGTLITTKFLNFSTFRTLTKVFELHYSAFAQAHVVRKTMSVL